MSLDTPANPHFVRGIDRLLSVQRPVVLAHIRSIRAHKPDATPAELIRILEHRYLTTVTASGAAVGASAVLPAVGVAASLALSGVETVAFLEASALFAQSVTEVHGIAVDDPDRARALVMTMMLGSGGSELVRQLAGEVTGVGPTRTGFWGDLVTKSLPSTAMGHIADQIKRSFMKKFVATQGTNIVGRAIPFGIGAVIGGTGNNVLGRKVISSARKAFAAPPADFPLILAPRERPLRPLKARDSAADGKGERSGPMSKLPPLPKFPRLPALPKRIGWVEDGVDEVDTAYTADKVDTTGNVDPVDPRPTA
ncbi:hypothetical protein B0I08_102142 [Glaciihabitans tibetensis]|uniref:EcsC family protein n=1 Tax=Glaciihabitans tibetensis TaxID=1266600 RepID=A0A2T0VGW8_9MICO|nr:hypothetical protein [Glaciihabitans tibetensis]PRY69468.1 hypothetical protein B0I08_102142 [Glaciihabitans tibetensis]